MGIIRKIRRHAAVASGNFAMMFKDVKIPPLPEVVTCLIAEINQPEPDIDKLATVISSSTGIAAKVIKTVNSALYSLRTPVTSVKHAVTLLGLSHIRSIAIAYGTMDALPKPDSDLFDHEAFWTDSLLRAIISQSIARKIFKSQAEEAFTAALLADIALPVLLSVWGEYYEPIIEEWKQSSKRLSEIEREHFGWDHAQAGAWILQSWEFPDEMVCYVGAHNLPWDTIREVELENTIVAPIAVSAISSSVLKPDPERSAGVFGASVEWLSMTRSDFVECMTDVKTSLGDILELFDLPERNPDRILDDITSITERGNHGEES